MNQVDFDQIIAKVQRAKCKPKIWQTVGTCSPSSGVHVLVHRHIQVNKYTNQARICQDCELSIFCLARAQFHVILTHCEICRAMTVRIVG